MNIIDRILEIRNKKDISQADFARLLELTPQALSRYEKGKVKPSTDLLSKICLALPDINGHWLLTGKGEMYLDHKACSITIDDFFIKIIGGRENLKNIEAINLTGDSMEPTLRNGDVIFIDKAQITIDNDGIYAFSNENGLFVKRIQKRLDGFLDIISDNKEYPIQKVYENEIEILGKVIALIGKST